MKLIIVIMSITWILISGPGCQYKIDKGSDLNLEEPNPNNPSGGVSASIPGFAQIKTEILDAKDCTSCHEGFANYATASANARDILSAVANDYMPKNRSPLTPNQKRLLKAWVDGGAPENAIEATPSNPATPPGIPNEPSRPPGEDPQTGTPPSLDWVTVKTLVIEPKCLGCHSAPDNRGGVNLETYRRTTDEIDGVEETIRDGSMPKRTTLSPEQKKLILDWIEAGAPEFSEK